MSYGRVAVIGASGFIGRYVVKRLARRGIIVTAVLPDAEKAGFLQTMGDVGQIARVTANITDPKALHSALENQDAVINLVGVMHETKRATFDAIHHKGAASAARIAKAAGAKRFIQISALGADPASSAAYARSKAEGEEAVRTAFPGAIILRPSVVFGPEDAFFNRFAELSRISPALPLIGGGRTRFQPVFVGDVADAIIAALFHPEAEGKTYELGGPGIYTFHEVLEIVLKQTGRKRWLVNLPWERATALARYIEWLPYPALTRDQVALLRHDNVIAPGALTLAALGIEAKSVESILPLYMDRYRLGGWYEAHRMGVGRN